MIPGPADAELTAGVVGRNAKIVFHIGFFLYGGSVPEISRDSENDWSFGHCPCARRINLRSYKEANKSF